MNRDQQTIFRAKIWLQRIRDQFYLQISTLNENENDYVENVDEEDDRPVTRAVLSEWIAEIDDIIKKIDIDYVN